MYAGKGYSSPNERMGFFIAALVREQNDHNTITENVQKGTNHTEPRFIIRLQQPDEDDDHVNDYQKCLCDYN